MRPVRELITCDICAGKADKLNYAIFLKPSNKWCISQPNFDNNLFFQAQQLFLVWMHVVSQLKIILAFTFFKLIIALTSSSNLSS